MRLVLILICLYTLTISQALPVRNGYWQQRITCTMKVDFDVQSHQYTGTQTLEYFNNSTDTLNKVFYHLYYNAFRPGSEMHEWTKRLPDPDTRILSKIEQMTPAEIGFMRVSNVQQDGLPLKTHEAGTILAVFLAKPLPPGSSTLINLEFNGQVPIQTRRSGRYSSENIAYSMAQWFPKICNYDQRGWHAHPYVQREFYGVWGDYDVEIQIDKRFVVAATGYETDPSAASASGKRSWRFKAPNVHDFVWAADPNYKHDVRTMYDGTEFHFYYVPTENNKAAWEALPEYMDKALQIINSRFGQYPYKKYSIIQGGDGGMEYPMATLITGERPLHSLVGVSVHELMHSWYQMVLGFNESYYHWMDEGFTSFASNEVMAELFPDQSNRFRQMSSYQGYFALVNSGQEEPMITHADHFLSNFAYGVAAYNKGAVFLHQLGYIIGQQSLDKTMLAFFDKWKFKHPTDYDFIRVAEEVSGIELDWYQDYWVYSTRVIDYAVDTAYHSDQGVTIRLENAGTLPMPIDLVVKDSEGYITRVTIPLDIMRGSKQEDTFFEFSYIGTPWPWTDKFYSLTIPLSPLKGPIQIFIDPSFRLADIDKEDNVYSF